MGSIDTEDFEITEADVFGELCRKNFYTFVQEFWSVIIAEDPVWNWHIEYLCDELQKYVERVAQVKDKDGNIIKRREAKLSDLLINIPPGTTKSTICTVMLPAWAWTVDPTLRILTASYSQSLSTDHALKSRDIIRSDKYRLYFQDLTIKTDQDNKTHYKNEHTGERYATSVGGTITGFHAHIIIVDDPLNAKEEASQAALETANTFMDTTLSTRKVDKAVTPTILVMQRLNENDPSGNWLSKKGKKLQHIKLPATDKGEIKPEHLKLHYVDGKLDAVRMTDEVLADLRLDLGEYGYSGQMQQDPAPEDGGIWQKWFIPVEDNVFPDPEDMTGYGSDWDTALTEKEINAASANVVSGKIGTDMYIDDFNYVYKEFPDLIAWMRTQPEPHYIEAKASGKSAKQTLVKNGITAIEVGVTGGDKVARTRMATPYVQAGRVYCRKSILDKLYNDSEQGILKFPRSKKLDVNDALVQAIQRQLGQKEFKYW